MTIDLSEQAQQFIRLKLKTGHFTDESAVIAHALDMWENYQKYIEEIRTEVDKGIQAADEGRGTMISSPEEATAFAETIKQRGRELEAERKRTAL